MNLFTVPTFAVLDPKGLVALGERNLIVFALGLMLSVAIVVIIFAFLIAWKYRSSNTKSKHSPDLHSNNLFIFSWWAFIGVIVVIMATTTWQKTHELDPFKPLRSSTKPLTIQVIALQWKWLFIYPEQKIATVNFVQFPANTPINFELTADAPMNSFWIPQLGGQMYAMTGMGTNLHLIASEPGEYAGSAAEISGAGFAGMRFTAKASTQADFDNWIHTVKMSPYRLNFDQYTTLAKPSEDTPVTLYSLAEDDLYNKVIGKFMPMEGSN